MAKATVTPGKVWQDGERVTYSKLSQTAKPDVEITGALSSLQIEDGAITNAKISDNADIEVHKLAIAKGKILIGNATGNGQAYSMNTSQILVGGAVTEANIATVATQNSNGSSVTLTSQDGSLFKLVLDDNAVTNAKIGDLAVDTAELAAGAATAAKIDIAGANESTDSTTSTDYFLMYDASEAVNLKISAALVGGLVYSDSYATQTQSAAIYGFSINPSYYGFDNGGTNVIENVTSAGTPVHTYSALKVAAAGNVFAYDSGVSVTITPVSTTSTLTIEYSGWSYDPGTATIAALVEDTESGGDRVGEVLDVIYDDQNHQTTTPNRVTFKYTKTSGSGSRIYRVFYYTTSNLASITRQPLYEWESSVTNSEHQMSAHLTVTES